MTAIETYTYTKAELEDNADVAKTAIVKALITEGFMKIDDAEEWCKTHTVIIKKKPFFRTITDLWIKKKEDDNRFYYTVVKDILQNQTDRDGDPELKKDLKLVKT